MIVLLPTLFRGDRTPTEVLHPARGRRVADGARLRLVARHALADRRRRRADRDRADPPALASLPALAAPVGRRRPARARPAVPASRSCGCAWAARPATPGASRTCPSGRSSRSASGCSRWRGGAAPARRSGAPAAPTPDGRGDLTDRPDRAPRRLDPDQRRRALRRGGRPSALIATAVLLDRAPPRASISGGLVWILGVATLVWRRFNQEYRLTVAESPDGLRVHSGLVALTAETIRPGRVQAVRMVEPLLWRRFGWCRLEVDVAGAAAVEGRGAGAARAAAHRAAGRLARARRGAARPPRSRPAAARVTAAAARALEEPAALPDARVRAGRRPASSRPSGRLRRVTCWVPLEKAQSFREVQGPVQRRLGLATVHVDTAGRGVRATLRDRDAPEADRALAELPALRGRAARLRQAAERPRRPASRPGLVARPAARLVRVERADLHGRAVERRGRAVDEPLRQRRRARRSGGRRPRACRRTRRRRAASASSRTARRGSPARARRRRRARRGRRAP